MIKILFISHKFYPDIGGIEVNSEILANNFQNKGCEVCLLTWTEGSGIKSFPFKVIRNPSLQQIFISHQWADVIYENNPCLRMSWPNLFIKRPLVVALRTWIGRTDGSMGWQDKLKMYWLKRAAASIAVSEAVRLKTWPKATVIGNPYRQSVFRRIPNVKKDFDFVFLGRLVSDKGADLAIRALKLLIAEAQKTSDPVDALALTVIGDGPERSNLEGLANELGIGANVTFKGNLVGKDLVYCLNQHKILLVPSIWEEPFGNVALEGMACGCIPIVSDRGGLPDAVGKAGLTFNSGNVNALVETIQSILNNPSLEENLRNAAAEHLKSHHPDIVAQKYLDIIKTVVKNKC